MRQELRSPALLAALLLSAVVLPQSAFAQASAPPPLAAPASSPPTPSGPRLLSPAEKRDNADAAAAPDLRPDRPVVPQIRVPFDRAPPVSTASAPRRSGGAAPPGPIGDAAASCEAQPSDQQRASCRKQLAQAKPPG